MNTKVNHIPKNWHANELSFSVWMIEHIKSEFRRDEDYQLLRKL